MIPSFLAVFYGLVSFIFLIYKPKKILSSLLFFSLIFGIIEFIRGSILTGFPWNLIAYSFSNQIEFISIISITGTYGFNLFCILLFTCPAIFLLKEKNKDIGVNIIILLLVIFILIYGSFYKNKYNSLADKNLNYKLRIIGSNVELNRFYQNVDSISIIEELTKISKPNLNDKTIFVWPEGILPEISQESLNEYKWLFNEKFSENHLVIIGMNTRTIINNSENYFNSLSLYDNDLNLLSSYNKINFCLLYTSPSPRD